MRWSSKAYQSNRDTSNYLSFSSPLYPRLSHPAFRDRNFRSVLSFRARVSRHHRRVSPGRIPCQSKHRGNLLLSDAALRRSSRSVTVSVSCSLALPFPFSLSLFTSCLPPRIAFLRSPLFPTAFVLSSSFALVFFPLADERQNALGLRRVYGVCSPGSTKTWNVALCCSIRTHRPRHANAGHRRVLASSTSLSSSCLSSLSGFLSCAFPRSFFSPRSYTAVLPVSLLYVYLPTISMPPPLSRLSLPPPLPSTDTLIRTLLF